MEYRSTCIGCRADWLAPPKNTISPSWHSALFARIKVGTEKIILIRWNEICWSFLEAMENLTEVRKKIQKAGYQSKHYTYKPDTTSKLLRW
jgi:hypothetical protein